MRNIKLVNDTIDSSDINKLIKWLETNPKIQKNSLIRDKVNGKTVVYHSFIINLLPAKESGVNVCACATSDCARTCLHQSGNIGMLVGKSQARFRKTWYLYMQTDAAVKEIVKSIANKKKVIDRYNASSQPYMDFDGRMLNNSQTYSANRSYPFNPLAIAYTDY